MEGGTLPREVSYAELLAAEAEVDRAVDASPEIDRFCSSLDWVAPAHETLQARRETWIRRVGEGFLCLAVRPDERFGPVIEPLECLWGFACPFLGGDVAALVDGFFADLAARSPQWQLGVLPGIPAHSALLLHLLHRTPAGLRVAVGPPMQRYVAALEGGVDGYLARRTAKFREGLRRAERAAAGAGVRFERIVDPRAGEVAGLLERINAIEARSWKGLAGRGVNRGAMRRFYARMIARLVARSRLRLIFARLDEADVGYIYGGLRGSLYRGLQFSFDDRWRALALGNLLQMRMIAWLVEAGLTSYDLGQPMAYKRRWGEPGPTTVAVYVVNAGAMR
ncbi:MAG: GNAT family N-acetyltransferase [Candidatus Schekmanbacteria bacterium]|nr:GNAT family N-acetyltransferase [Candidatus Schekmanbacteria bacterium]